MSHTQHTESEQESKKKLTVAERVKRYKLRHPEKYKEIQNRYWKKNPAKYLLKTKRYQTKYPKKLLAQKLVNQAIKRGDLIRKPCQHCQNAKSEAHHEDYLKPLEVQWLCKKHHVAWHKLFIAVGGE